MKYLKYFENAMGTFDVSNKELTSLINLNIPNHVTNFFAFQNKLTSLEYCPKTIGGSFICSHNKITSLEFSPKKVNGNFYCHDNHLTTLKGGPEYVGGNFNCSNNQLTTLEFCPKIINGDLDCIGNNLTSLDFFPDIVDGNFYCHDNKWVIPIPYNIWLKTRSEPYTNDQLYMFLTYDFQKEFLTNHPEKYKDLEPIGYNKKIKEEFDWLFNAIDMELM
jgi:hypothetical protein